MAYYYYRQDFQQIARLSAMTGTAEAMFEAMGGARHTGVLVAFLDELDEIPDWLIQQAVAAKSGDVVHALLRNRDSIPEEVFDKLLRTRNPAVAKVFAGSKGLAQMPTDILELFAYSSTPRVRVAFIENDALGPEHHALQIDSLLGRTIDGDVVRNVDMTENFFSHKFTKSVTAQDMRVLATSVYPSVLLRVVGGIGSLQPSGTTLATAAMSAIDGIEYRRTLRTHSAWKAISAYRRVLLGLYRYQNVSEKSCKRIVEIVDEYFYTSDAWKRSDWDILCALDLEPLRKHVGELVDESTVSAQLAKISTIDELATMARMRETFTREEMLAVVDKLRQIVDESGETAEPVQIGRTLSLLLRYTADDNAAAIVEAAMEAKLPTDFMSLTTVNQNTFPIELAAQVCSFYDMLSFPAERVANLLSEKDVNLPEIYTLAEAAPEASLADLVAILA